MTPSHRIFSNFRTYLITLAVVMVSLFFVAACGDEDVANNQTCKFDVDCGLGTVCGSGGSCVSAACDFCTSEQICYKTPANPEGTCSAPQCQNTDDCDGAQCVKGQCVTGGSDSCTKASDCPNPDKQTCTLAGKCVDKPVEKECENTTDCANDGEICDANNKCTVPACTETSCGAGKLCGTDGKCKDAPICDPTKCETNERCLPSTGACGTDCVSDASLCGNGEMCDKPTATCITNPCPNVDPASCGGNTPHLSPSLNCSCVQCTDNTHCGPGKVCGSNGSCTADQCQKTCDSATPGSCNGAAGTPYCVGGCCSQCIGAADCPGGQLCLDGFCGVPPNCDIDPTVCPQGYTCEAGACKPPASGNTCSQQNPDCPPGQVCNGTRCENVGGGMGCGMCNDDCTCPNGLSCDMGFQCTGCSAGTDACPMGQICDKVFNTDSCWPCEIVPFSKLLSPVTCR